MGKKACWGTLLSVVGLATINTETSLNAALIANPYKYLVMATTETGDPEMEPMNSWSPVWYSYVDFDAPGGGGFERRVSYYNAGTGTAVVAKDQSSPSTWGLYTLPNDGGDEIEVAGDTVRIRSTRDGGTTYVQYFVGPYCQLPGGSYGDGWLLWDGDLKWATWTEKVARLSRTSDPNACPPLGEALTRYVMYWVDFPNIGVKEAVITEHYDHATEAASERMERFFSAPGLPMIWQAFGRTPPDPGFGVPDPRCPDFGWNIVFYPGWYMVDCRITTNLRYENGLLRASDLWGPGK